jgi:hypothetical protein
VTPPSDWSKRTTYSQLTPAPPPPPLEGLEGVLELKISSAHFSVASVEARPLLQTRSHGDQYELAASEVGGLAATEFRTSDG